MSTAVGTPQDRPRIAIGRVTQLHVIRSEWTKLWSLRSTRWSLLVAVVGMAGLGIVIAAVQMAHWNSMSPNDRRTFNPVDVSTAGFHFAQLALGVLGVLVISGEYSTGMIRSSFAAVPKRLPVLWAKLLTFGTTALLLMLPSALLAFFVAQAILQQHHVQTTFGSPHVARAVIGSALFLTVVGLLGGIATLAGVLFVLPGIAAILPNSWGDTINPYLPNSAGEAITAIHSDPHTLSAWNGFALFCAYTAVATIVAAVLLVRRDA
jgi:ABC-type transport system involved in multi-copper enzyme maturation permease subunit